jgi:hypothetical protein
LGDILSEKMRPEPKNIAQMAKFRPNLVTLVPADVNGAVFCPVEGGRMSEPLLASPPRAGSHFALSPIGSLWLTGTLGEPVHQSNSSLVTCKVS